MNLRNNRGCFGGGSPKAPAPTPLPAPAPVPTPQEVNPQLTDIARRQRLEQLRAGMASTIKTSSRGIFGQGSELQPQTPMKTVLG